MNEGREEGGSDPAPTLELAGSPHYMRRRGFDTKRATDEPMSTASASSCT